MCYIRYIPTGPGKTLQQGGFYKTARKVVSLDNFYYLITEKIQCGGCKGTWAAWHDDMMNQLGRAEYDIFPAVLTYKGAVDKRVISLHRIRTLGNSVSLLRNQLVSIWSNAYNARKNE